MNYRINLTSAVLIFLLLPVLLFAQEKSGQLSSARKQLQQIRSEISQLQGELSETEEKLEGELSVAENLDKQISLVEKALRLIKGEIDKTSANIKSLKGEIKVLKDQIEGLQNVFGKQIVFAYKHQRGKQLQWLLGSESLHQALVRYMYFQKISQQARSYFDRLVEKKNELAKAQAKLQQELDEQQRLASEKQREQKGLEAKQSERKRVITRITKNRNLLSGALEKKKKSYQELERLIAELERQRGERQRQLSPEILVRWEKLTGDFAKNKGKHNWPVTGKIVHGFGKYRNPQLKTVLNNTGIDIRAEKGTAVRCIFQGIVSLITYMSGFGNTVIIDHNNGYYTVYTHLDEVRVSKFQLLEAGDVIGSVGTSGSLEGAMLHFEIYGANKPLNPLTWLKKM